MYREQRIVGVVEARMGSKRLPGKVLMALADRPVLWHVVERAGSVDVIDEVVVATTTSGRDDTIAEFVDWLDDPAVRTFRGPEDDMLERYYLALRDDPPDLVVRIPANAPLVSMRYLRRAILHLVDGDLDGVDSDPKQTGLTPGLGCEAYRYQALVDAHLLAVRPAERQTVPLFIRNRPHAFRIDYPPPCHNLCSPFRLSLECQEDYQLLRRIYRALYRRGKPIDCEQVVRWLGMRPDLAAINAASGRERPPDYGKPAAGE